MIYHHEDCRHKKDCSCYQWSLGNVHEDDSCSGRPRRLREFVWRITDVLPVSAANHLLQTLGSMCCAERGLLHSNGAAGLSQTCSIHRMSTDSVHLHSQGTSHSLHVYSRNSNQAGSLHNLLDSSRNSHKEGSVHDMFVDNRMSHQANSLHNLSNGNALCNSKDSVHNLSNGTANLHPTSSIHDLS